MMTEPEPPTLKQYRLRTGLSQKSLGYIMGVTRRTVRNWENGEALPPTGRLIPLTRALDISIIDLMVSIGEIESLGAEVV